MKGVAKLSYLNIAPRKMRLVADLIRGKSVESAQAILRFTVKRGSQPIAKLLHSAVANAKNNFQVEDTDLYIAKITVDEGPKRKRWKARSRGSAGKIQKKTSHIAVYLDEIAGKKPAAKRKKVESKTAEVAEGQEVQNVEGKNKPKFDRTKDFNRKKGEGDTRKIFRRKSM